MRVHAIVVLVVACALAGCPATQSLSNDPGAWPDAGPDDDPVGGRDGGAGRDGGGRDGGGGTCEQVATCGVAFTYTNAAATAVSLRGDFAPGGWTTGVAMIKSGDTFTATVDADDGQAILYKLVVDGTWMVDPGNPETVTDDSGNTNSVRRARCDDCDAPEPPPPPPAGVFDWRDAVLYFVMIDRFANGSTANDDPTGLEPAADYQGGDLAGLRQKIEDGYFDELGVNALWLTSPLDGGEAAGLGKDGHRYSAYHGYWPRDLDAIEARVGTEAELAAVIDAAHDRGIKVVIDYVMNHVHDESPVYRDHPDWFWPNRDPDDGSDCICGQGCSWDELPDRERCWFDPFLPDFNFEVAAARAYSVDNAIGWARRLGLDGYRLDAVKHLPKSWLVDLRRRLRAEVEGDAIFYLVGETFTGDAALIREYVDPATMLDGQFDFPLRARLLETILRRAGSMSGLVEFLDANARFYAANAIMSTFIGNHDVPRAIHFAEDTPLFSDWDDGKARAWTNRPGLPASPNPFERVAVAYTLLMATPGIPLIYYGDEIGMAGAGDPDNRRTMQWSGYSANQSWLKGRIAALTAIRAAHPALRRGVRRNLGIGAHTYVYEMTTSGDAVVVALNRGDEAQPATGLPAGSYTDLVTDRAVTAPLSIPPRTGMVLVRR
jgi:glycosidase